MGRAQGLTRGTMRHPQYRQPHRGVRAWNAAPSRPQFPEVEAMAKALDYLPRLRVGEAFSHTTALLLLGVPIQASPALHVVTAVTNGQARSAHVTGHRTRRPFRIVRTPAGLPCVQPIEALLQAALLLPFRELVVALDHLSLPGTRHARISVSTSREAVAAELRHARHPRIARMRAAHEVSRVGAESRMESLMHFELARMGLDELELQAEVFSTDGEWIGRFDAAHRERMKLLEYDGEQHRTDRGQYLRDAHRLELARRAGHEILRLHREDFRQDALPRTRIRMQEFLGLVPKPIPARLAAYFAEAYSPLPPLVPDKAIAEPGGRVELR
ncbi:hypothetical protein [Leucobacter luti]|uniref:hypothetical protein n=1 Tax=Leucobacter luti TaxID=340320 RepID=UPI001046050C|nr:hypothetical protein [Leucobacter luti]MCW2287323.1 hypothetical protein [Leucobacter luti]